MPDWGATWPTIERRLMTDPRTPENQPPLSPQRPDAADIALVATAGPWSNEEHLTRRCRIVARALRTWRAAKGL